RCPVLQGILLALCFWLGFYVKLWAVYILPPLAAYYLSRRAWRAAASFAAASLVLHGATLLFWKAKVGQYLPCITPHAATYPIPFRDLPRLLLDYPKLVFVGSDIETTLFGAVPYLWVGLLIAKIVARWLPPGLRPARGPHFGRWDRLDVLLLTLFAVFFTLLNFFPNSFTFDRYYSAPRIFRYLAPLSFPMTLHLAKMVLDLMPARAGWLAVAALLALTGSNLRQTAQATAPGRAYRATLMAVVRDVRERRPPMLVTEAWISYFLSNVYLEDLAREIHVVPIPQTFSAHDY